MKHKLLTLTLILLLVPVWGAFSGQDQVTESSSELERLDNTVFNTPQRPGAVFSHDDHNEKAGLDGCAVCHHVYENGRLVEDESSEDSPCSECHALVPEPDNRFSLSVAFHKRCRDCHFESGKGPVLCGECHIKE
jgi:hypothetical protein